MSRSAVEALLDADCPPLEKLVLLVIARHGQGKYGCGGYPSARRIVRMAGISPSTLHCILRSLRSKGWLSWTSGNARQRKANTYDIHFDKIPMIDWTNSLAETAYLDERVTPVSHPVSLAESGLSRLEAKPVSLAGHQASTEANTKRGGRGTLSTPSKSVPISTLAADAAPTPSVPVVTKANGKTKTPLEEVPATPENFAICYQNERGCLPEVTLPLSSADKRTLSKLIKQDDLTLAYWRDTIRVARDSRRYNGQNPKEWWVTFYMLIASISLVREIHDYKKPSGRVMKQAASYKELAHREGDE